MRAMVVLPVPRGPQNRYACAMRFCVMALVEGLRDVLLADDVGETLRAVFAGDDLIGHW